MRPILLASSSPYRQSLLERLGLRFTVARPDIDESRHEGESARAMVARLAEAKARAVAAGQPDTVIIGSDQAAVRGDCVLGKPGTIENAMAQLHAASGRRVEFLTGLCVLDTASGEVQVEVVPYAVQFRALEEAEIAAYIARESPLDCAGSFKSEGLGAALFEYMEGPDPSALIGLPLIRLTRMLKHCSIDVLAPPRGST
jgi:MAF protein